MAAPKLDAKIIVPAALVGLVALGAVASGAGWYWHELVERGRMGASEEYKAKLPARAAQDIHHLPQCSGNNKDKWVGCSY